MSTFPTIPPGMGWPFVDATTGEFQSEAVNANLKAMIGLTYNVLDFGVERGTSASQTGPIEAALAAHPGAAFRFPPGDYRLDVGLEVMHGNSLILEPGSRIYAHAAMGKLIDYDNWAGSVSGYAQDVFITGGGILDGNLLADDVLSVARVIRCSLSGFTIVNPVENGLYLAPQGAEVITNDIRIHNTGTTNVTGSVGIKCDMGDCHFSDVIIRDFTTGVHDNGSANVWEKVHPWIGDSTQVAARYPTSIGFLLTGNSTLIACYPDTYRTKFKTGTTTGGSYSRSRLIAPRTYVAPGNVSSGVAAANPGVVFNIDDGGTVVVSGGYFQGHPDTPDAFLSGNTGRLTAFANTTPLGVTGLADYLRGVRQGVQSFTPTVYGSTTPGTTTYSTQTGYAEVRDGFVRYHFVIVAQLGAAVAGNLRIGGVPKPTGAVSVQGGFGELTYASGAGMTGAISSAFSGSTGELQVMNRSGSSTSQVAAVASANVQLWGYIECPYTYP